MNKQTRTNAPNLTIDLMKKRMPTTEHNIDLTETFSFHVAPKKETRLAYTPKFDSMEWKGEALLQKHIQ